MAKNNVSDVSSLVQEWDEITARLWKGGYREADFLRPEFREYLGRLTSSFTAMADWARQRHPHLTGELAIEAKPTQQELENYARDFDRIQLKRLLPKLSQAAEQRGIDSSAFLNLGSTMSAMLSDAETIPLADAAWTTVERLRNRVANEQDESAAKTSQPRDDSPTAVDPKKLQSALEFIKTNGPKFGKEVATHIGVKQPTFRRHYVKGLEALGVCNVRGKGYLVP